ncbi:MAG TPA: hypothetical protein VH951_14465 [Dehalococcoidia bacterium]|jgi:hypothetical protein
MRQAAPLTSLVLALTLTATLIACHSGSPKATDDPEAKASLAAELAGYQASVHTYKAHLHISKPNSKDTADLNMTAQLPDRYDLEGPGLSELGIGHEIFVYEPGKGWVRGVGGPVVPVDPAALFDNQTKVKRLGTKVMNGSQCVAYEVTVGVGPLPQETFCFTSDGVLVSFTLKTEASTGRFDYFDYGDPAIVVTPPPTFINAPTPLPRQ